MFHDFPLSSHEHRPGHSWEFGSSLSTHIRQNLVELFFFNPVMRACYLVVHPSGLVHHVHPGSGPCLPTRRTHGAYFQACCQAVPLMTGLNAGLTEAGRDLRFSAGTFQEAVEKADDLSSDLHSARSNAVELAIAKFDAVRRSLCCCSHFQARKASDRENLCGRTPQQTSMAYTSATRKGWRSRQR